MNKLTPPNRLIFSALTVMLFCLIGHPVFADEPPPAVMLRERLQGRYEGVLPCADCPGIEYRLTLKSDGTYSESAFYLERSQAPLVSSGVYRIENEIVVLDNEKMGFTFFQSHPKGMRVLEISGRPFRAI